MKSKNLLVVISKSSGKQSDVQKSFEEILKNNSFSYDIKKVTSPPETSKLLRGLKNKYQTVAVYGGDGTIVAAIKALAGSKTKILILPGGTANTVAVQVGLSDDANEVLNMFILGTYKVRHYDLALANTQIFVLDMHSGWWTEAVKNTPRELKRRFGATAYGLSALKRLPQAQKEQYVLEIDGKIIKAKSYTTIIANQGYQHFLGVPLFPKRHHRGVIKIAFIKDISFFRIFTWIIGRKFSKIDLGGAIKTYSAHEVIIKKAPQDFLFDDTTERMHLPTKIVGGQSEVYLIAPTEKVQKSFLKTISLFFSLNYIRFKERIKNALTGQINFDYTQIAPYLYVGGTYRKKAYSQFKRHGITGVVNMRSRPPKDIPEDVTILHLQTKDWTPPTLEDFAKGVKFIRATITKKEAVYVHCRQGEGRGPSMAAAYLVSEGMGVEEAIEHIKKSRPMAGPNRKQVKRLVQWQKKCTDSFKT